MTSLRTATLAAVAVATLGLTACGGAATGENSAPREGADPASSTPVTGDTTDQTSPAGTDDTSPAGTDESTPAGSDAASPTGNEAGIDGVTQGGEWSASVDGKAVAVEGGGLTCVKTGKGMLISVIGKDPQKGNVSVSVEGETVTTAVVTLSDGSMMSYQPELKKGSMTATVQGSSYAIKGEGPVIDPKDMTKMPLKPVEMSFTCK